MNPRSSPGLGSAAGCVLYGVVVAAVLAVALGAGSALARDGMEREAGELEADILAAERVHRGQWVEFELNPRQRSMRTYVSVIERDEDNEWVLMHRRIDHEGQPEATASVVETLWLDCDKGEQRVLHRRGFTQDGKPTFTNPKPDATASRIAKFYRGMERSVCSFEYLFPLVPDAAARFARVMAELQRERRIGVPDRTIPVPPRPEKTAAVGNEAARDPGPRGAGEPAGPDRP